MSNFDNFFFYIKEYWPIELTALRIENTQRRSLTLPWEGIQGKMLQMNNCLLSRIFRDRKLIAIEMKNIYDVRDKSL